MQNECSTALANMQIINMWSIRTEEKHLDHNENKVDWINNHSDYYRELNMVEYNKKKRQKSLGKYNDYYCLSFKWQFHFVLANGERVCDFLISTVSPEEEHSNWLQCGVYLRIWIFYALSFFLPICLSLSLSLSSILMQFVSVLPKHTKKATNMK